MLLNQLCRTIPVFTFVFILFICPGTYSWWYVNKCLLPGADKSALKTNTDIFWHETNLA